MNTEIEQELIKKSISYDPNTGKCFWIKCHKNHFYRIGKEAGKENQGRFRIKINGTFYARSRVAIFLHVGVVPVVVDHINGITTDDRICNLRSVTSLENAWNRKLDTKKESNLPAGVSSTSSRKFISQITINYKKKYLGTFETSLEAHNAYLEAKEMYHGEYRRTK